MVFISNFHSNPARKMSPLTDEEMLWRDPRHLPKVTEQVGVCPTSFWEGGLSMLDCDERVGKEVHWKRSIRAKIAGGGHVSLC